MGNTLGFPSHNPDDTTPPPVEVRLDGADTPAEAAGVPTPGVEAKKERKEVSALRRAIGVAFLAAMATSCNVETDTSTLAGQGGEAAESAETVEKAPQVLVTYKEDLKGFEIQLWSLNKPVRFELVNKADPQTVVEVEFEGGQKEEAVEGSFEVPIDNTKGASVKAYDVITGKQIPIGNPAPEGGMEWAFGPAQ